MTCDATNVVGHADAQREAGRRGHAERACQQHGGLREGRRDVVAVAHISELRPSSDPRCSRNVIMSGQGPDTVFFVGGGIDDVHPRAGLGETRQLRLRERTDDDAGNPAFEVARDVFDTLAAAEGARRPAVR